MNSDFTPIKVSVVSPFWKTTAILIILISSIWFSLFIVHQEFGFLFFNSAIILIISTYIMHKIASIFNFTKMKLIGYFWYTYLIMIYIPSIVIYFEKVSPYRDTYIFAVQSVFITIPVGAFIANKILLFHETEAEEFYRSSPTVHDTPSLRKRFCWLFILAIGFTIIYMIELKTLPLWEVIKRPNIYDLAIKLRVESFLHLKSKLIYVYSWLRSFLYPFLIIYSLGNYLLIRRKFWKQMFIASLLMGIFNNSITLEKLPVAAIFIMLGLFYLFYRKWKVNTLFLIFLPVVILAGPILILTIVMPKQHVILQKIFQSIIARGFYVPAEVLYLYFEIFPAKIDFLSGASIKTLSTLLGKDFFNVPEFVFRYWFNVPFTRGHANAAFIGNMYANWGTTGVLVIGLIAGFIFQLLQIFIYRQKKSILTLSLLAFFAYSIWLLNSIDLLVTLQTGGIIFSFLIFWLLKEKKQGSQQG